jgi:chromosome partitioning protein
MRTITFLNEKGGVGKTTFATYAAVGLTLRGYRVLLIDADAQGNASSALSVEKSSAFTDVMLREDTWANALQKSPAAEYLYVLASNLQTSEAAAKADAASVRRRLAEISEAFDYVLIDTAPTPTMLHNAITLASDYVVIPTDCESFSAWEGLPDSIAHIENMRVQAKAAGLDVAQIIGIVPNRYRAGVALHDHFVADLKERYGALCWEPIPQRISIAESQLVRRFLFTDAPALETTGIMRRFVDTLERSVS